MLLFINAVVISQDKITLNYADSLSVKIVKGEQVREAIGNVSITHNRINITCSRVIQYFSDNKAELFGNVKVIADTLIITAPYGIYYGNEGRVVCPNGAVLRDPSTYLSANYGVYSFIQDLASFRGNVMIEDKRSYVITSQELDYYRSVQKSYARGKVRIITDSTFIYADSLVYEKLIGVSTATGNVNIQSDSTVVYSDRATYYDLEKKSVAEGNVIIHFLKERTVVYGDFAENQEKINYSVVKGRAVLIHTDSSETDSTLISANQIESFRGETEFYIAKDSVKSIRDDFLSSSDRAYYFRNTENSDMICLGGRPAVWKDNMQLTGDSIYSFFKNELNDIYIKRSAFAIISSDKFNDRFDQIRGIHMHIKFMDNEVSFIQVDTNAASIYFIYNNDNPDGANKSEGDRIEMTFSDKKIIKVKIFGKVSGTYYPENLVKPEELLLQGFILRYDKPDKYLLKISKKYQDYLNDF
jgi:lipopolysaccharide export system protein LptA